MGTKECQGCKEIKIIDNFPKDRSRRDGHYRLCRACVKVKNKQRNYSREYQKNVSLKRSVGITYKVYTKLLDEQKGVCAICKGVEKRELAVDHCHENNWIRGLLCSKCNMGLGLFNHNPELLRAAIGYLEDV